MSTFTSKKIKAIYQAVKDNQKIIVRGKEIKITSVKEADSGEKYAKVRIEKDPGKTQYLEFYWENGSLYFGIDLSEDIHEFLDFKFENFQPPISLKRNGKIYTFSDKGISKVTESDNTGDYYQGDQVYFWEYFDSDKKSRISLGYNNRSKKWLNMFAERLTPEELKVIS
ncbi:MAG: hypothetical protein Q7S60_02670 [bacterium]|nr:hypothetical protein [bacterium]